MGRGGPKHILKEEKNRLEAPGVGTKQQDAKKKIRSDTRKNIKIKPWGVSSLSPRSPVPSQSF